MGLVIDTNVFIDIEQSRLHLKNLSHLEKYGGVYIAAVTMSELLTGVHLAKSARIRIRRSSFVERIISKVPVLDFDEDVARTYAELYSYFIKPRSKREGNVHDLQIAATAITYGYPVLTSNVVDFKKVPGIAIETL